MRINILPVNPAVGATHQFRPNRRSTMIAFATMVSAHYDVPVADVCFIYGGSIVEADRVRDIGCNDGDTVHLMVTPGRRRRHAPRYFSQETIDAATEAYEVNWGRVSHLYVGVPTGRRRDPIMPNHHERNFMLTVAMVLTEGIPDIVHIRGLPGKDNFLSNCILAIMYYYHRKGWDGVHEQFLESVHNAL